MPGRLAGGRRVIDAPEACAADLRRDRQDGIGEMGCESRIAVLVGDHAQLRPLTRQPQHGLEEVVAVRAVDPSRAQDHVPRVGGSDRGLALQL
jgi:hypothetical protein